MPTPVELGGYDPQTAKTILEVVRYLQAAGFVPKDGQRGKALPSTPSPVFVRNYSGEEVPGWACMQATGTVEEGGVNYVKINKPTDTTGAAGAFLFNGPDAIEVNGFGIAFAGPLVRALGDGSTATAGASWQPMASDWKIKPGGTLLTMVGGDDIDADVVRVVVASVSGAVIHAKTQGGGIAGMSGLQMASASCDLYNCSAAGLLADSGNDVTIYNPSASAVAATTLIVAAKNSAGLWIAIVEDCG